MLKPKRCRCAKFLCAGLTVAFGAAAVASGQQGADTDWAVTTGNNASQRYAPLDQIDRGNFAELEVAWRWSSPDNALMAGEGGQGGPRMTPRNHEAIPIKVGDRIYVTTGYGQIAAVDVEQGTSLWTYDPQAYLQGRPANLGFVHRGATHWDDPDLPAHTDGSPITFLHRGRQYLVFALGGRGAPFELIAYRLPA